MVKCSIFVYMKVKDLKKLLVGVDDEMNVLIPTSGEFDGVFSLPCIEESGVSMMGIANDIEELSEPIDEVLTPLVTEEREEFLLVPCGFFDHKDKSHEMN